MTLRIGMSLLTLCLVLTPSTAPATTPLPDPPFAGGGYTAPSYGVLKQEEAVNKLLVNDTKKRATCDWAIVGALQLAYTPVNATKVAALQEKWTICQQRVDGYYVKYRDRLLEKGTPPCLDQAAIDMQRAIRAALWASFASTVFCDDGGAAPDPVTGLNIPEKKQKTIGEVEVAKLVIKTGANAGKCYSKAAKYALTNAGVLPQTVVDKTIVCLDRVAAKIVSKVQDLEQTQKLPGCLPVSTAVETAGLAASFAGASTAAIYCASPSGAFLDGAATL